MPSDRAICFCIRTPTSLADPPGGWVGGLATRCTGGARVERVRSWSELRPADVAGCDFIALLDEASEPAADWFELLRRLPEEFDVLTSAAPGSGPPAMGAGTGEAGVGDGTVLRSYVLESVGLEGASGESFVDRCRRFGFRVGALGPRPRGGSRVHASEVSSEPPPGLNVFGFLSGNLGLGVAARHYLRRLLDTGVPVHPVDIQVGGGRARHDVRFHELSSSLNERAPHPVNLFIVNPPDLAILCEKGYPAIQLEDRINICIPFWELARVPEHWLSALRRMDLVFAASRFIQYTLLAELVGPRVGYLPVPLQLEPGISEDRRCWGLSESAVIFASSFEMASDMNRKNPYAAIDAFGRAFAASDDVLLLIKVNNAKMEASFEQHLDRLRAAASSDPRILIIEEVLSYADVLSLYACSDVFISLHRAEGLGLGMLEAMHLGKPVIATGWSGNLDFMNERNSCLVGYDFIPVQASTQAAYTPENLGVAARWADPHLDDAANWMRRLADDADLRRSIGKQAAADMATRSLLAEEGELLAAVRHVAARRGIRLR